MMSDGQVPKAEGDDPVDQVPDSEVVEVMSITVMSEFEGDMLHEGISSWYLDQWHNLYIVRAGIEVAVYAKKHWAKFYLAYKMKDGREIDAWSIKGIPESVGLGVSVTAIGGRTS